MPRQRAGAAWILHQHGLTPCAEEQPELCAPLRSPDNEAMFVRNVALLLCVFLHTAFCQNFARILVQGMGNGGPAFGPSVSERDFSFSASELALLPQRTIAVSDHGAPVTFQGVLLAEMLAKVTTPTGDQDHHTAASYYLVAEGRDGYRAVFAWAELDSSFTDKAVYVVITRDGKPLPESDGPFQLVVPGEKSNVRWVRQLSELRIEPNTTPYGSEPARWIRENLPELESIKVDMTWKDLLKVFTNEGGISTRTWQRYVYRKCIYVKVDVEFEPVGSVPPRSAAFPESRACNRVPDFLGESPDDRITKISKPYLELTILD